MSTRVEKPGFLEQAMGTLRHWQCSIVLITLLYSLGTFILLTYEPQWLLIVAPVLVLRPLAIKLRLNLLAGTLGLVGTAGIATALLLHAPPSYIMLPAILLCLHAALYFSAYSYLRRIWEGQARAARYWWWESWLRAVECSPVAVLEMFEECENESPGDLLDWVDHIRAEAAQSNWEIRKVDFPGEFLEWLDSRRPEKRLLGDIVKSCV